MSNERDSSTSAEDRAIDKRQTECLHKTLYFGSGDFYVICRECSRYWRMEDAYANNVGAACRLSGEERASPSSDAALKNWADQVRLTVRGIDAQAERLTKREQTTWRDGEDQEPKEEDFEEIITGYKLNTGLWHRLLGLLAQCPAKEALSSALAPPEATKSMCLLGWDAYMTAQKDGANIVERMRRVWIRMNNARTHDIEENKP